MSCQWPPKVIKTEDLGYVEDTNGRYYPRDIGISTAVNGVAVFQFGDTFVHDDKEFVGVSCSNAAVVRDPKNNPQKCTYCDLMPDGKVPVNPPLLSEEEEPVKKEQGDYRTTTWCFGGIVFEEHPQPDIVDGYTFFQKSHIAIGRWEEAFQQTGLAKVALNTTTNHLSMTRNPATDLMFTNSEPRFGTFSTVTVEGFGLKFLYAYGHAPPPNTNNVLLARVAFASITDRSAYEYFDGSTFQSDISKCAPIMTGMQHGNFFRSSLFSANGGPGWVFIGCNSFADSTVYIGRAYKPEGPWDVQELVRASQKTEQADSKFTYCMFGHPWAFDGAKGELMLTWSEGGMRGKVVAVKVTLAQV